MLQVNYDPEDFPAFVGAFLVGPTFRLWFFEACFDCGFDCAMGVNSPREWTAEAYPTTGRQWPRHYPPRNGS